MKNIARCYSINTNHFTKTGLTSKRRWRWYAVLVFCGIPLLPAGQVHARTDIYLMNGTEYDLNIQDVQPSGSKISKKAWKKGVQQIPIGQREKVFSVNRTGKFNWMDPTPRFVEPGKTTTFTATIAIPQIDGSRPLELKIKLLGTGKSSKMWYSVGGAVQQHDWVADVLEIKGLWQVTSAIALPFVYRTYVEKGKTHVEYILEP